MSGTPHIFEDIGEIFTHVADKYLDSYSSQLINAITPIAICGVGLYIACYGYMVLSGKIQEPFKEFIVKCVKIILISAFALNCQNYMTWVVSAVNGLQEGLASINLTTHGGQPSTFAMLDRILGQGFDLGSQCMADAGISSGIISYVLWVIAGLVIDVSCMIMVLVGGTMIIIAKLMIQIMLAIGPLFIMCMMWSVTSRFFENWLSQTVTYILKITLMTIITTFMLKIYSEFLNPESLILNASPLLVSAQIFIVAVILYHAAREVGGVASGLGGGISMTVLGMSQLASAVSSPFQKARDLINPVSTRRDMQSGMLESARRSSHLIAGNTVWNPAFSQNVLANAGKNWGWRKGGNVTK